MSRDEIYVTVKFFFENVFLPAEHYIQKMYTRAVKLCKIRHCS